MYPSEQIDGIRTKGLKGDFSTEDALSRILKGTGFTAQRMPSGAIGVVRGASSENEPAIELARPLQRIRAWSKPSL